jgi:hypothetical protein
MKDQNMSTKYSQFIGKVVEFTEAALDLEDYAEAGIRAVITKISINHDLGNHQDTVLIVEVDHTDFDDYNKAFEGSNYFNDKGVPCLTAREADLYKAKTRYYISPINLPGGHEAMIKLVNSSASELHDEFVTSGQTNYVAWLEEKVLANVSAE